MSRASSCAMNVWVDADICPLMVKEILYPAAVAHADR
jgi:uncharacterized protein YaiI (UPF0178 family)